MTRRVILFLSVNKVQDESFGSATIREKWLREVRSVLSSVDPKLPTSLDFVAYASPSSLTSLGAFDDDCVT